MRLRLVLVAARFLLMFPRTTMLNDRVSSLTMRSHTRESPNGFSLIEVLVVIAIAGAILGIAWVRMSTLVPIYRLEGAARSLAAEIQRARERAIAESKCFQVSVDTSQKTYQLQWSNDPSCTSFPNSEGAKSIDDAGTLTVAKTADPVFVPRGTVTTGAHVTLTNSAGAVRAVYITQPTGRVYVQ